MAREICDGIFWFMACHSKPPDAYLSSDWYEPGREVHGSNNAFLIKSDRTLLFDNLAPNRTDQIIGEMKAVLGDQPLDYLVPSHPENPHAGNTFAILEEFEGVELVAPGYGNTHEIYHLEDSKKVEEGDVIDLGQHVVRFVEPVFMDHYMHVWMYEETQDVLFCVDWFGLPHMAGECLKFTDEISSPLTTARLGDHATIPFFWLKYANSRKIDAAIDAVIDEYGSPTLAPAHGLVIREKSAERMRQLKESLRDIVAAKAANP